MPICLGVTDQPQIDLAWSDPELDAALFALDAGDPRPALALVGATVGSTDRHELVVGVLGEALSHRRELVAVVGGEGADDPDRLLLWGAALFHAAADARGADVVERTSHAQFASMSDLLRQTRSTLRRVLEVRPDDTSAHMLLMCCAQAESYEADEVHALYAAREAAGPLALPTVLTRVATLAPRWHGSTADMLGYARSVVAGCGDGDPLLAAIAAAHVEDWVERGFWRSLAFGFRPKWRGEVDAASDRLLAGAVEHPSSLRAHQVFGFLYSIADQDDRVREHLRRGGTRVAPWPWGYRSEDPAADFAEQRSKVGLA